MCDIFCTYRDSVQNFDILLGGKWDHRESENSTLHAIWTLLRVEISILLTSSRVSYNVRGS